MRIVEPSVRLQMPDLHPERGKRFAALRQRKGLGQEELARLIGVSHGSIQNWEAGRGIRSKHLRQAAEVLETTPEEITGIEEPDVLSLAEHLNDRVDEFRRFSFEMRDAFAEVQRNVAALREEQAAMRGDLDRQYAMLAAIFRTLSTPEAAAVQLEAATELQHLAEQEQAAARAAASKARGGKDRQRRAS